MRIFLEGVIPHVSHRCPLEKLPMVVIMQLKMSKGKKNIPKTLVPCFEQNYAHTKNSPDLSEFSRPMRTKKIAQICLNGSPSHSNVKPHVTFDRSKLAGIIFMAPDPARLKEKTTHSLETADAELFKKQPAHIAHDR